VEILILLGVLFVLWKIFSSPSKSKTGNQNNTVRNNRSSSHSSTYGGGNSTSGGYQKRVPYSPISETSSGIKIKSDSGYIGPFKASGRRKSDFNYPENPNPQEFLVYFIASEELQALKIGVGTSGRVLQLLNSTIRSEDGFENVGWKVLKTAAFSTGPQDFESGRTAAYEAERRVLFYWRKHLNLSAKVSERDMGWAELDYLGKRGFHLTKGFTETVDISDVCEISSWNIVKSSPGYLGEGSTFYNDRDLRANSKAFLKTSTAPGYTKYKQSLGKVRSKADYSSNQDLVSGDNEPAEKTSHTGMTSIPKSPSIRKNRPMPKSDGTKEGKFWARVQKENDGCWNWIGSISTDAGYAQMLWEGSPRPAHRIAWQLKHGEMPKGDFLINSYGTRTCVNPDHWELKKMMSPEERTCLTENCGGISVKKMVDGYCAKCERRREYEYRKTRPNPYECINPTCTNPSGTVAFASLCMPCRRKEAKKKG
jgi:hypothetical protein